MNDTLVNTSFENGDSSDLPIEMQFNQGHLLSIIVYSILFVIAAVGNITLLVTIIRIHQRSRLGRVNLFLLHLAIADLMVTFILMPLEIGWAATVYWTAGDLACRVLSFFRTFGLYLSGFLLVCISFDRYFAVLQPLTLPEANHRGRMMLTAAWIGSIICSLPQAVIFHVERHPKFTWYEQCVTFNFFPSKTYEVAYSIFSCAVMYGFPLVMIVYCYTCILYEIFKIHQIHRRGEDIRRSNIGTLGRAKVRTLKMTVVIVCTFCCCWAPYNMMSLWYWIDEPSAQKVDQRIQKGFFLFAVTNSCFNPIVYGLFHIRRRVPPGTPNVINGNLIQNIQNNGRHPYRFRVRWKSHGECMCASNHSCTSSSSNPSRPMYEVNGVRVYLNNNGNGIHLPQNNRQYCARKLDSTQNSGRGSRRPLTPRNYSPSKKSTPHSMSDKSEPEELLLLPIQNNSNLMAKDSIIPNGKLYHPDLLSELTRPLATSQTLVNLDLQTSPIRTTSFCSNNLQSNRMTFPRTVTPGIET